EGGVHPAAQIDGLQRRGHPVNGQAEGREYRAPLGERHAPAARELQQGRSLEAAPHHAQTSLQRHPPQHPPRPPPHGRRAPRGPPRWWRRGPRREPFLEQFYDLAWPPGGDVRRAALVDLLAEGSLHRQSSRRSRPNTDGGQKKTLLRSWLAAMIVACPRPQ